MRLTWSAMADRQSRQLSTPHKFNSLVAAAEVMTSRTVERPIQGEGMLPWQEASWLYYDTVGEFRFGVGWLGNAMSRVNLVPARPPTSVNDDPVPIDPDDEDLTETERRTVELVNHIAGGATGQGQMLCAFGKLLSIAGFAWLVAEPDLLDPDDDTYRTWNVLSQDVVDVRYKNGIKTYFVAHGSTGKAENWRPVHPNALVVKTWRPHPRRQWEPDAPVRAVLTVLEQLDLLSAHITASGKSRLAGAGLLVLPSEAEFPPAPVPDDPALDYLPPDPFDYFVDQLIDVASVAIKDRSNASAVVPLAIQIPGEYLDKVKHLTFATPFDSNVLALQKEAIQRFALGMDMPPEVLTGMSGVNHWTAWQVEDTAVTLHIEPACEIVCQALTQGFLEAALAAEGLDPNGGMVWYNASNLTAPPDKSGNATAAYDRMEISSATYRRETGFGEGDAPTREEVLTRTLADLAKTVPELIPVLFEQLGMSDTPSPTVQVEPAPASEPKEIEPAIEGPPSDEGRPSASQSTVVAACDGICHRAMERAGARLKVQIGRKLTGGPQAVDWSDSATLHTQYDPTVYADLDALLAGAFDRVPEVAEFVGLDSDALARDLNSYCRGLLASQNSHEIIRLSGWLGAEADAVS